VSVSEVEGSKVTLVLFPDQQRALRCFDQVVASEGCIIEVRGYEEIPFAPEEMESVIVNHKHWTFREASDIRVESRAAA
jgi:hypothetical protein